MARAYSAEPSLQVDRLEVDRLQVDRLQHEMAQHEMAQREMAQHDRAETSEGQVCQVTSWAVAVAVRSRWWTQVWWYPQSSVRFVSEVVPPSIQCRR